MLRRVRAALPQCGGRRARCLPRFSLQSTDPKAPPVALRLCTDIVRSQAVVFVDENLGVKMKRCIGHDLEKLDSDFVI